MADPDDTARLLVEDDDGVRPSLRRTRLAEGYHVVEAATGREAYGR